MQRRGLYTIFRNCFDLYFDRINDNLDFTTEDTEDTEVFNKFKSVVSVIQRALARRISSPCIQCAILIEE